MTAPAPLFFRILAASPDIAKAIGTARPVLLNTAIHLVMTDQREFVIVEGGETLEVQRTGHKNQLGEEVIVFSPGTSPLAITDDQIAEQRALYKTVQKFAEAAAAGKLQMIEEIRMSVVPDIVRAFLDKSVDEQRQWIELEASTEEWDEFISAMQSTPEPEQGFIWTLYVMRPHRDIVNKRHPSRAPRGSA